MFSWKIDFFFLQSNLASQLNIDEHNIEFLTKFQLFLFFFNIYTYKYILCTNTRNSDKTACVVREYIMNNVVTTISASANIALNESYTRIMVYNTHHNILMFDTCSCATRYYIIYIGLYAVGSHVILYNIVMICARVLASHIECYMRILYTQTQNGFSRNNKLLSVDVYTEQANSRIFKYNISLFHKAWPTPCGFYTTNVWKTYKRYNIYSVFGADNGGTTTELPRRMPII